MADRLAQRVLHRAAVDRCRQGGDLANPAQTRLGIDAEDGRQLDLHVCLPPNSLCDRAEPHACVNERVEHDYFCPSATFCVLSAFMSVNRRGMLVDKLSSNVGRRS
jgi:hypothetical protein